MGFHKWEIPKNRWFRMEHTWLVVWNMNKKKSPILGMMIQSDFHSIIFQRGRYTTNQVPSDTIRMEDFFGQFRAFEKFSDTIFGGFSSTT
jgi:hypothetical protein